MDRFRYYSTGSKIRFFLGLIVVIFFVVLIVSLIVNNTNNSGPTTVAVKGQSIQIELAETEQEKQIGLSETEALAENEGMLFVFDTPDFYPFWMKNMKFPIDIIYINGNVVTTVIKNAMPSSADEGDLTIYRPTEKSDKVLEVNAGYADKYDIQKGTTIDINNL